MIFKKLHHLSGITISIFVVFHLLNHLYSLFGASSHIEMMSQLRVVYRLMAVEILLLLSVSIQIVSGIQLFLKKRKAVSDFYVKLQVWTGLYLAFFFLIHVSAVLAGRLVLGLDTNFYFGVAGLNTFPLNLFFIPYYGLAIISFFGHLSAVHSKKMKMSILGVGPKKQSHGLLFFSVVLTLLILYGLTNGFTGFEIPDKYGVLIGK